LANSFQHKTIDSFLTIVFKYGLQLYLLVATIGMKRETFQQHKEATLVCEEGFSKIKAMSNLSIPQRSKTYQLKNLRQFQRKHECILQIVTRQIIMLKLVESKGRKTMFLQSLKLQLNRLKYRGL
jgi:hypothetical protein